MTTKFSFQSIAIPAYTPALNRRISRALTALLAAVAVWLLAQWVWLLITPASPLPTVTPGQVNTSASRAPTVNVGSLTRLNLFGESSGESSTSTQQAQNAPKTQLNLRLVGVSASSNPLRSAAIIEQGNSQQTYIIGDELQNASVTVVEIYADRVILDNNGRLETLELEGIGELSDGLSLTLANSAASSSSANNSDRDRANSNNESQLDAEELSRQMADIQAEPSSLFNYVKVSPVQENGELIGYRLSPGQNPELFRAAGLESGDLAVSINGYDLTNISSAMAATEELKNSSEATIAVMRNDEYIELEFSVPAPQDQ